MKYLHAAGVLALGFALGFAASSIPKRRSLVETETATLRTALQQAQQSAEEASIQRDRLKDEAKRLRAAAEEVHPLRADVARLTRELAERQAAQEQLARAVQKSTVPEAAPVPPKPSKEASVLPVENAPLAVQTALYRELGHQPINGVFGGSVDKNGQMTYGFKGQTSDQRGIAIRFGEDGSVLEKSTEIPADLVPAQVQAPAAQVFGALPISAAREIVEGDRLTYELSAKGPESGMQAIVRGDGTLLSYSAKWRPPASPGKVK